MKKKLLFVLLLLISHSIFSQKDRKVVVLDMTAINIETNSSRYISVTRMLESAGVDFETTSSVDTAILYPIIITGSRIESGRLNSTQITQITDYVNNGGIFITSSMREAALFPVFGISGVVTHNDNVSITWDISSNPSYFWLVDDSLEKTVSIGDTASLPNFNVRSYTTTTATVLGHYQDGLNAFVVNDYGAGKAFAFGTDFRDIYLRNQLDFDVQASRTYSNGFEPTSDVFMFIVRNIIRTEIPNTIYKYTAFGNATSTLMITHDLDSETAIDTMLIFSDYEKNNNIVGQYNVTTRYFSDENMSPFYVGSHSRVHQLIDDGHVLASHSVGHFPDFADEIIFPFGTLGNTTTNYNPGYFTGITTGGTILGELEVSKFLIEDDHSVRVRSFRAGHLAYPDSLAAGLALLGYEFNSTQSANNILTGFPYYQFMERSFDSPISPILEIPMTISDVFQSNPINSSNYLSKVSIWINATRKYEKNNTPVVLLIHPNRTYKLQAQIALVDSLSPNMKIVNMEAYGDFWRKRDSLQFYSVKSNDTLFVHFENNLLTKEQSFVIDTIGVSSVLFFDYLGQDVDFISQEMDGSNKLFYQEDNTFGLESFESESFELYPNPTSDLLNIELTRPMQDVTIRIYDIHSKLIHSFTVTEIQHHYFIHLSQYLNTSGIYLLQLSNGDGNYTKRFVFKAK